MLGRPTIFTEETIDKTRKYINGGWEKEGDKVPSIAGLACYLGLSRETLRLWDKDETHPFFGMLEGLLAKQERVALNGGLSGEFSGVISKLVLAKHGYSDRQEVDHQSSDGSMTPQGVDLSKLSNEALAELVAARDAAKTD